MSSLIKSMNRRQFIIQATTLASLPLITSKLITSAEAKAPMLGIKQPKHIRFKLGDFEFTNIVDCEEFISGPYPIIGKNATKEEVIDLMKKNLLPLQKYQPGFTPTVLNTGKELILFDTGNGDDGFIPKPKGGWLAEQMVSSGYKPEQIDIVIITHGHPDHVAGIIENGKEIYPNARYVIGQKEYDYWAPLGKHSGELEKLAKVFRDNTKTIAAKFTFIKPGDEVVPGIQAFDGFGHTPGQLCFHVESKGQRIFFWADCAHHHVASLARPDWHCVFDIDKEQGAKTRKRIYDMLAHDQTLVMGYHMPFPGLGYVENIGKDSYRWLQHSFQLK
jgi:glyoxylase-like metal-dependent hydrolase (beta-lactamase superfamily II)